VSSGVVRKSFLPMQEQLGTGTGAGVKRKLQSKSRIL
jgi:hypothetical protein